MNESEQGNEEEEERGIFGFFKLGFTVKKEREERDYAVSSNNTPMSNDQP